MKCQRSIGASVIGLLFAVLFGRPWHEAALRAQAGAVTEAAAKGFLYQGVASCTAVPCHRKQDAPLGTQGTEYLTWLTRDPHARAFAVLSEERSQRMSRLLGSDSAEKNLLCLQCHATPMVPARPGSPVSLHDGVGCESCHGPAEKWLDKHFTREWKTIPGQDKSEKLGFAPLSDLTYRAQSCMLCHVGAGSADVNHDLIAAGHPWLHFEFGSYLANYPKHWSDQKYKDDQRDFEARVWLTGQVVAADAALRLLAHRADPAAQPLRPWPEFAEYDCFACHHDLADQRWRRAATHIRERPGALPWNDWYVGLAPLLEQGRPAGAPLLTLNSLQDLRSALQQPYPDRGRVVKLAAGMVDRLRQGQGLDQWSKAPLGETGVLRWLKAFDDLAEKKADVMSWDQAAQVYLALAALDEAAQDLKLKEAASQRKQFLQTLRTQLGFPALFDSPRGFDPAKLRRTP